MSELSGILPEDAYNGMKSNDFTKYDKRLESIRKVEKELDLQFNGSDESLIAYRGAKNSLATIVTDIQSARDKLKQSGDIQGMSELFREVTTKFDYVKQNIDSLILIETKNLAKVTQELRQTRTYIIYGFVLLLILGTAGAIFYAFVFSKKLTEPIINLSETASRIAEGDLTLNVRDSSLKQKDEIGSLSVSFDSMVHKLRAKFDELQSSQALLEKSKKDIEQRNQELERFNNLVIDRELKMVELKKRIAELENSKNTTY